MGPRVDAVMHSQHRTLRRAALLMLLIIPSLYARRTLLQPQLPELPPVPRLPAVQLSTGAQAPPPGQVKTGPLGLSAAACCAAVRGRSRRHRRRR